MTVLTGAGISAPSGVPTFRGPGGLWRNRRPEELATPGAFETDPAGVWEWYDWRRQKVAACQPNPGHEVLAVWSNRIDRFTLVTQNVDGLHERAGTPNVIRFHGSIWGVAVLCALWRPAQSMVGRDGAVPGAAGPLPVMSRPGPPRRRLMSTCRSAARQTRCWRQSRKPERRWRWQIRDYAIWKPRLAAREARASLTSTR